MTKEARVYNVGRTVFSTNGAGKTGQPHVKKMKLDHSLTPYTKTSSQCIKDLNVRLYIIKFLEENIGRTLSDISHSNIFFDASHRIMEIKANINKWDLLKLKSFCRAKETINKMERQPTDWEKIFGNEATDKELIPQIFKFFEAQYEKNI